MNEYQRYLTPGFEPFDPLELARETEKVVTKEGKDDRFKGNAKGREKNFDREVK
ncbi:MAG: hypothetical protein N2V78_12225 [Methanophagales archaeon]|nr:hypothetical protein [Methanophagales archaeon]